MGGRMRLAKTLVLLAVVMQIGCAPYHTVPADFDDQPLTPRIHPEVLAAPIAESPCTDSLYLSLKSKSLESMTEREYQYFIQKDAACSEFQRMRAETKTITAPQKEVSETLKKSHDFRVGMAVIGSFAAAVYLIILASK